MKLKIALLLLAALVLSACSAKSAEFIIANNTKEDLVVQFKYKNEKRIIYKPRITTVEKLEDTGRKWLEISLENYEIDPESRVVRVKLAAGEALLVTNVNDYQGHEKDEEFGVQMINLSGSSGVQMYEGKDAQTAFKKQTNGNYVIFYE